MKKAIAYFIVILVILAAGAGGYYYGSQYGKTVEASDGAPDPKIEEQAERIAFLESTVKELEFQLASSYGDTTKIESAPTAIVSPNDGAKLPPEERAKLDTHIFTDPQGRELVATIVKVNPDSVTIRRINDGRIFDLSHSAVIPHDREFLEYLYSQQNPSSIGPQKGGQKEKIDWEAIFDM